MSVVDQIKRIAGRGAELTLRTPHTYFIAGNPVQLEASIVATQDITIREVFGELMPRAEDLDGSSLVEAEPLLTFQLAEGITLAAGERTILTAAVPIPSDLVDQAKQEQRAFHWILRVTLDIPAGLDITATCPIVLAPPMTYNWATAEPIMAKTEQRAPIGWYAEGTFTVGHPETSDRDAIAAVVSNELIIALSEYLASEPGLAARMEGENDAALRREVAGALREIAEPRVREVKSVPLDAIADVTIDRLSYSRD